MFREGVTEEELSSAIRNLEDVAQIDTREGFLLRLGDITGPIARNLRVVVLGSAGGYTREGVSIFSRETDYPRETKDPETGLKAKGRVYKLDFRNGHRRIKVTTADVRIALACWESGEGKSGYVPIPNYRDAKGYPGVGYSFVLPGSGSLSSSTRAEDCQGYAHLSFMPSFDEKRHKISRYGLKDVLNPGYFPYYEFAELVQRGVKDILPFVRLLVSRPKF